MTVIFHGSRHKSKAVGAFGFGQFVEEISRVIVAGMKPIRLAVFDEAIKSCQLDLGAIAGHWQTASFYVQ